MEPVDPWFYAYTSESGFNTEWGALASSALGVDSWKDVDTNNIHSNEADDYLVVSNKGGLLAKISRSNGTMLKAFKFAPGTAGGSAGTANYGGMCVTNRSIAVVFAVMVSEPDHSEDTYAWMVPQKNEENEENAYRLVKQNMPTLSGYDMKSGTHLWTVDVPAGRRKAAGENGLAMPLTAGITCIGEQVLSACPHYPHICLYSARTGSVVQVVHNSTVLGTGLPIASVPTVSAKCDDADCFQWGGGEHVTKYKMVSDDDVDGYQPSSWPFGGEVEAEAEAEAAAAALRNGDEPAVGEDGVRPLGPYDNGGAYW
jgi:hypothetical protein